MHLRNQTIGVKLGRKCSSREKKKQPNRFELMIEIKLSVYLFHMRPFLVIFDTKMKFENVLNGVVLLLLLFDEMFMFSPKNCVNCVVIFWKRATDLRPQRTNMSRY